ncbi:LruC domain-containing protein [Seonamhaeicola maritimus]|uniref:LruC domain-containing protein n=2 Tax=Seonamhaeicola maritimus TaxID=2591822 RepID=A0A5C7GF91_9FLAO|nr:LruC domain-containing protein [Seonamhaeicola maritimus]
MINFQHMSIMKNILNSLSFFSVLFFFVCSCDVVPEIEEENIVIEEEGISINVPNGFDFSTQHEVQITINDNTSSGRYDIYAYSDKKYFAGTETFENQEGEIVTEDLYKSDLISKLVFSGVPFKGVLSQTISLPKYYDKVYIRRNDNLKYTSSIENIVGQKVDYNYALANKSVTGKSGFPDIVSDFLYCVNGSAQLFQVDPLTGNLTDLSDMPMGSWTCAIDQENKTLYSIGKSSPYPLMKYSIENDTWEIVANIGRGGPRLDYNYRDGLLYFSTGNKLYTYNPTNGVNLNTWVINGLHSTSGGDLAFAEDGTLFLCTFSGLYRLELDANNEYQSSRISSDNLPFQPTSMTFDSNQELWLANNANSSDLIIMDTQTGGWQYNYGVSANNNTDLGRTINDLTTFRVFTQTEEDPDTDGDGIVDRDDSYPDDANKAFEMFTPSKYGWGTVAFEDLWPTNGDYDFNDLAVNYRVVAVLNAEGLAVQLDFMINTKSNRASFTNGFGIELESILPSQIESVSGNILTHNYINQNANGTEAGQDNAVIIIFDDSNSMLNSENKVSVKFTSPVSTNDLGTAPFNPFMIIDKLREKEVHLAYMNTTTLGLNTFEVEGTNNDADGNYISNNGFPWAINIVHDFKVPKESKAVNKAYNHFDSWAISGGLEFKDWYKDNPGYRNSDNIQF